MEIVPYTSKNGLKLDESFNLNEMNPTITLSKSLMGSHKGVDVALEYKQNDPNLRRT